MMRQDLGELLVPKVRTATLLRWCALQLWLILLLAGPTHAAAVRLDRDACHAVSATTLPDQRLDTLAFHCTGTPSGYQRGSLWLRIAPLAGAPATLMVHQSRFDRLAVGFRYANGTIEWQHVRSGDFGAQWRPGAQIAFIPANRSAKLRSITLRFDRLASHELLRVRQVPEGDAELDSGKLGALIGAALTLLLIGGLYNASLAIGVRRQYLGWQAAWALVVFLWGAAWSQLVLLFVPGMAGTLASQICTLLSCWAVALATMSAVTSIAKGMVPGLLRGIAIGLACGIALLAIPAALVRDAWIGPIAAVLGLLVLAILGIVALCLGWAWRRGSVEARDLVAAWSVPMLALGFTQIVDIGSGLWGGGAQIVVLFASAWQTIWLSLAASRNLSRLRAERDLARAAEARASALAERDSLTGIRNRRGFVTAAQALIRAAAQTHDDIGLLVIDVDRFKAINDEHGHDAGDQVLTAIAARLARWEGAMCAAGRLGGEEFGVIIRGLAGHALTGFADHVRLEIAACDHQAAIGARTVTVSIGVAEATGACVFEQLYRQADGALYAAKRSGRDRVCRVDRRPTPLPKVEAHG